MKSKITDIHRSIYSEKQFGWEYEYQMHELGHLRRAGESHDALPSNYGSVMQAPELRGNKGSCVLPESREPVLQVHN